MRIAITAVLFLSMAPVLRAAPEERPVDVVLCLDTSGSMNGLIDSAKRKLWAIVNDLAKLEPSPTLRVSLYCYGSPKYGGDHGFVSKLTDLTGDLDEVYKKLNGITISGGTELVARVTHTAIKDLKWSTEKNALKLIFVCGNESVDQDRVVSLSQVAELGKKNDIYINTIFCGSGNSTVANGWRDFAITCGGKYANIDQNRASAQVLSTPFDAEIQKKSAELNNTYVWYGASGDAGKANQKAQDENALKSGGGAAVERGATKATKLYRNAACDLVDRMQTEKDFDLKKVPEADLPEELKKLKPEERLAYVKAKADERAKIQVVVAELAAKRAKFIEVEQAKEPKSVGDKAFDDAIRSMIQDQAKAKNFRQ